jgi:hypothetical protein
VEACEGFLLSDWRIGGIKSSRARLYPDAGVDTIDRMARWHLEELRLMLIRLTQADQHDGTTPLPAEAAFSVAWAKEAPRIVEC